MAKTSKPDHTTPKPNSKPNPPDPPTRPGMPTVTPAQVLCRVLGCGEVTASSMVDNLASEVREQLVSIYHDEQSETPHRIRNLIIQATAPDSTATRAVQESGVSD